MKVRNIVLLCIMIFAQCQLMYGTKGPHNVLSGTIASTTGEPLIGAFVQVLGSKNGAVTNIDGQYTLKHLSGKCRIQFSFLGYETQTLELAISQNTTKNIVLKEMMNEISNVVVVAKSKVSEVKSSVYAVNAIDVSSRIASISSISDVVEEGMGVRIRRDGGLGSDYNLTLNGMGSNSIRYFIDGVPMDSKGANFSLDNIPTNLVERVEVYKGVVPSHLGGDALGGAINIITKENRHNYYDISYGLGSFHTHKGDFNAQIIEPKTGIIIKPTIGINYSKNDYIMRNVRVINPEVNRFERADCRRFHDDYKSLFGQLEFGVTGKNWADYLYASVSITDVDKDIQSGATQDVVYGAATRSSLSKSFGMRYKKDKIFVDGLSFNANISHTIQNSTITDTAQVIYYWNGYSRPSSGSAELSSYPVIRYLDQPRTNARANLDYKIGTHSNLNVNYLMTHTSNKMDQETTTETEGDGRAKDILLRQFIGLGYSLKLFDDKWQSSAFLKEFINTVSIEEKKSGFGSESSAGYNADNNVTKYFTSYGAGTRYQFLEGLALKASYEYSVRLPGVYELLGNSETILANYSLEPEKSHNYNLGVYGNINLDRAQINYEVGGFYRNIHDYIMAVQGAESSRYDNLSNIRIKGIEAEASFHYDNKFLLRANVSCEEAVDMMEFKLVDGKPNATYKQQVPNRPTLYGNASAIYNFYNLFRNDDKLVIEYRYEYVKWFFLTWSLYGHPDSKSVIPTQHNSSASLTYSWHRNRYSVSIDCNNLYDKLLYDNYMLQKPGRAFFCKFRVFIN